MKQKNSEDPDPDGRILNPEPDQEDSELLDLWDNLKQ